MFIKFIVFINFTNAWNNINDVPFGAPLGFKNNINFLKRFYYETVLNFRNECFHVSYLLLLRGGVHKF